MRLYLDHNSTTPLRPEVRERWLELLDAGLGNPSSVHASGRRARAVIDEARARVAAALGVGEEWVIFTSGGTEANNTALAGVLGALAPTAGLVVGATEHSSILEPAKLHASHGRPLEFAPVDAHGVLLPGACIELAANPRCSLLSLMVANNEVGAIAPMSLLAVGLNELGSARPVWHVDAVQALGRMSLDLRGWAVDLASFSAHKLGGPPGVGILVRNPQLPWVPSLLGGGQESDLRAGTESTAALGAAALAIELAVLEREQYAAHTRQLTRELWERLAAQADAQLLGPPIDSESRLCNTLNLRFPGVAGHALVARLDLAGLEVSVGSACSSGALEPSHVLLAMGASEEVARSGLRISMGRTTTREDVHTAGDILVKTLGEIRGK